MAGNALTWIGQRLARYINGPICDYEPFAVTPHGILEATLQPGDVLLVEGNRRVSVAIKYLTQSTWSHAALYVGDALGPKSGGGELDTLVEADIVEGVRVLPLSEYRNFNTRICRPIGLSDEDREAVIRFAVERIGLKYDLKNIFDLLRYLLPTPPVPTRWRRRMLQLGSGDPTQAICSGLIAQAFQSVRYPILPHITVGQDPDARPVSRRGGKSCISGITACSHRATSISRHISASSNQPWKWGSITGSFAGTMPPSRWNRQGRASAITPSLPRGKRPKPDLPGRPCPTRRSA